MKIAAQKTNLETISPLRRLYLQSTNFQIRYHACHERGWSDSYLLTCDGSPAGYGAIKGQELAGRDTVFEFYLTPPYQKIASRFFAALLSASSVNFIECQSNDALLSAMLYEFARNINADVVLFADHAATTFALPEVQFRAKRDDDVIFEHHHEPPGEYVLLQKAEVVATGGFALHYNMPFADLYMEVREDCRRRGYASFLLQELKKECYRAGRVPAARCNIDNLASRATLLKAGLAVAGFMLLGDVNEQIIERYL